MIARPYLAAIRLAVEVNRHDRARVRADGLLDPRRIEREARGIDVRENRTRAGHQDRQGRVGGGQRRRDHFVAGADVERAEDERDRVGPRADADGMAAAHRRREFRLERLDLGPEHEPAPRDHAIDRGADVGRVLCGHEGEKRDADRGRHTPSAPAPAAST
jgi:hypothetical protein